MSPVDAGFPDNAKAASYRQADATIYRTRLRARQRGAAATEAGRAGPGDVGSAATGGADDTQVRRGSGRGDTLAQICKWHPGS